MLSFLFHLFVVKLNDNIFTGEPHLQCYLHYILDDIVTIIFTTIQLPFVLLKTKLISYTVNKQFLNHSYSFKKILVTWLDCFNKKYIKETTSFEVALLKSRVGIISPQEQRI